MLRLTRKNVRDPETDADDVVGVVDEESSELALGRLVAAAEPSSSSSQLLTPCCREPMTITADGALLDMSTERLETGVVGERVDVSLPSGGLAVRAADERAFGPDGLG